MSTFRGFVVRFFALILTLTAVGVTVVLLFIGYEVALRLLESGRTSGNVSRLMIAILPSLFALLSAPFWLTLRRLRA